MPPTWLLIVILIVLLLLGTAVFLYAVLRRARRISFSADPGAKAVADKKEPAPAEFLSYASNLSLRSSFRTALRLLKTYVTGKDYRYRIPWFLMSGESESGKTTILDSNGINLSLDTQNREDNQLNWYFFNEGVVLDVSGDFVLRKDGTANHPGWNTISKLLQKHRPQRPLDGVVLTIPCTELVQPDFLSNECRFKLEQKATCLYTKLWQSQRILGMRLPVYVLVTKCDEVTGFTSFCNQLPAKLRTQMFGWSNPTTLDTAYKPELVAEAFESFQKYISYLQCEIYAERDEIENADDLFLFPSTVQSMRPALQIYMDGLFKQSVYHESFFFRGLYFCGEASSLSKPETQAGIEKDWTQTLEPFEVSQPTDVQPSERKQIFVTDVFKEKVFSEDFIAQPIKKIAFSRNRTVRLAQVLSLLILVLGGGGIAATYNGLAKHEDELYRFLQEEEEDLKRLSQIRHSSRSQANISYVATANAASESSVVEPDEATKSSSGLTDYDALTPAQATATNEQLLHDGEAGLLAAMAKMHGNKFYSLFIPSSWFSSINERLESSMEAAFKYVIFESLRIDLERNATKFLTINTTPSLNRAELNDSTEPRLNQSFQLQLYIELLGELIVNLQRYERLIKGNSGSFDDLRHLVEYLNHAPLPVNFDKDNDLYKRALRNSGGTPIETRRFLPAYAKRVADRVEDLYEASLNQGAVKYHHLDEIAETEALLRQPQYTWLSTYVFEPRSQFAGMTISSALLDLKRALEDLKRQRFMSRDLPEQDTALYHHRVRSVLVWDREALQQAIALYEEYKTFVETSSYEPSEHLDNSVKRAARTKVKARMSRILQAARRYQPVQRGAEGPALTTSILEEIHYLHEIQEPLSRVLQIAKRLGVDSGLRAALARQASDLLREINREFVSRPFYLMKRTDFSWWDGRQPMSHLAYDFASSDDLAAYLNIQRKEIAFLARDLATPVFTFFESQGIYVERSVGQVDWNQILTDLDAFDNKAPGNPIAALETFIRTEMDQVKIESCLSVPRRSDDRSTDYFLTIRNSLRRKFYARCEQLAVIYAINNSLAELQNYQEIQKAFQENLDGGFPFSNTGGPELDPPAILKFFKVLDSREKAARDALGRARDFWASPPPAAQFPNQTRKVREFLDQIDRSNEFLDQVDRAREFFAQFLEKKQGPAFEFQIQFRVQPETGPDREIGGNQIIDWQLEVGKKKFAYLSDDLTGRWVFGDPIRLTLRWANNSPTLPVASTLPVPVKVKGRTAVFEYEDRWSLFTLLLRHGFMLRRAGTLAECDQGFDPTPYTLKFTINTEPDSAAFLTPQRENSNTPPAEVFMRLSMVAANKQEPLMLPCFPTRAPLTPWLILENTRNYDD